jgi:trimeric autotransporter adhesin
MALINGTNGNDTGFFGAVGPRILGILNPLNLSDDTVKGFDGNDELFGYGGDDVLNGGTGNDTMEGGNGSDIYFVDSAFDQTIENANSGIDTVNANFTAVNYVLSNNIENLFLSGGSVSNGIGNSLNNLISGNSLNNLLDGGGGRDTLRGGVGNDIYIVDNADDVVVELLGQGFDTVRTSVSYTLSASIENGELTGNAIALTGNNSNNSLTGNSAANQLDGGTGTDTMSGGSGSDTYFVNVAGDQVIELANQGTDLVVSSASSYALSNNVENLQLTTNATTTAITGIGNALNNQITGNQRDNVLDGGTGADSMIGGTGSDTYIVDNVNDVVTEAVGAGTDTIQTILSNFSLVGLNVENLTFTGRANATGQGNDSNNVIRGAVGNDLLRGGAGVDRLYGGSQNDTLIGGTGNDQLSGDAGNDALTGVQLGAAAGRGEIDTLTGGAGADTFFFAAAGQQFYNDGTIANGIGDFGLVTDFSLAQGDRINLLAGQQYVLGDAIQLGTGIQGTSISMAFNDQANEVIGIVEGVNLGSGIFSSVTNTNAAFTFS